MIKTYVIVKIVSEKKEVIVKKFVVEKYNIIVQTMSFKKCHDENICHCENCH